MKVFYTSPKSAGAYMQAVFDEIVKTIQELGHEVISLEVQEYSDLLDMKIAKKNEHKMSIHTQYVRRAIELADAAIFEGTKYSFKLGQEVQLALDKKVPALVLAANRDYSLKVQDPYFYSAIHSNSKEIKNAVKKFLKAVEKHHLNKRINVFLHNKHINFLDWYVKQYDGKNRSELIREAIEEMMDEDKEYSSR